MKIQFNRLNHIQLCIAKDEEAKGRIFYCEILGLKEIEKPDQLKVNGGFWVEIADVQIHIGTENLTGQSKRHPAFEVEDLEQVKAYLVKQGLRVVEQQIVNNFKRFSFFDYWDNRIEFMQKI